MIERWTTSFVDQVIEDGTCDFASVVGVPIGDDRLARPRRRRLAAVLALLHSVLAHRVGSPSAPPTPSRWTSHRSEHTITEAIATRRRRRPRDDVVSILLEAEVDGQPITDDAVYSSRRAAHLRAASAPPPRSSRGPSSTSSNTPSNGLGWPKRAAQRPRRRRVPPRLLADPGAGPHSHPRRPLRLSPPRRGRPRPAGLVVGQPATPPSSTIPTRWTSTAGRTGATAFGMGIHRCRRAHIGRAIARELIRRVITRMPDYVVDLEGVEAYPHQGVNAGFQRIPTTFTPPAAGWARDRRCGGLGAADRPRDPGRCSTSSLVSTDRHHDGAPRTLQARPRAAARPCPPASVQTEARHVPGWPRRRARCGRSRARARDGRPRRGRDCSGCTAADTFSAPRPRTTHSCRTLSSPARMRRRRGRVASCARGPVPRGRPRRVRRAALDGRARPWIRGTSSSAARAQAGEPAAGLALLARDQGEVSLAGQVLVYPMLDDREITASSREVVTRGFGTTRAAGSVGPHTFPASTAGRFPPARRPLGRPMSAGCRPPGSRPASSTSSATRTSSMRRACSPRECPPSCVYPGAVRGFDLFAPDAGVSRRCRRDRDEVFDRFLSRTGRAAPARDNDSARGSEKCLPALPPAFRVGPTHANHVHDIHTLKGDRMHEDVFEAGAAWR